MTQHSLKYSKRWHPYLWKLFCARTSKEPKTWVFWFFFLEVVKEFATEVLKGLTAASTDINHHEPKGFMPMLNPGRFAQRCCSMPGSPTAWKLHVRALMLHNSFFANLQNSRAKVSWMLACTNHAGSLSRGVAIGHPTGTRSPYLPSQK